MLLKKISRIIVLSMILFCLSVAQAWAQMAGTLIVLNKSDHTATIISLKTGKTLATLPTGEGPHEAAVSEDGKTAVVTNYGKRGAPGSSLTLIDLPNLRVIKTVQLGQYQRPHGIRFLPGSEKLLITAEAQKALLVFDLKKEKVEKAIPTDQDVSHMVAYAPKHDLAFVANIGSGSVSIIDVSRGVRVKNVPTGAGAEGVAVTPDETEVWVTNRSDNTISVLRIPELSVSDTLAAEAFPIRIEFSTDGASAFVSNAESADVAVFSVASRKLVRRVPMRFEAAEQQEGRLFSGRFGKSPVPIGVLPHPDGRHVFVANTRSDVVAVIDLQQGKIVRQLATGREPDGLGYSPLNIEVAEKE